MVFLNVGLNARLSPQIKEADDTCSWGGAQRPCRSTSFAVSSAKFVSPPHAVQNRLLKYNCQAPVTQMEKRRGRPPLAEIRDVGLHAYFTDEEWPVIEKALAVRWPGETFSNQIRAAVLGDYPDTQDVKIFEKSQVKRRIKRSAWLTKKESETALKRLAEAFQAPSVSEQLRRLLLSLGSSAIDIRKRTNYPKDHLQKRGQIRKS